MKLNSGGFAAGRLRVSFKGSSFGLGFIAVWLVLHIVLEVTQRFKLLLGHEQIRQVRSVSKRCTTSTQAQPQPVVNYL